MTFITFLLVIFVFSRKYFFAFGAGDVTIINGAFVEPNECNSLNCVMELNGYKYQGPHAQFNTRVFNGNLPGPTIRVKAGDTLRVTIINSLLLDGNGQSRSNSYSQPNTTNLHTHGLHVSSASGGDDVFTIIDPESIYTYTFFVPDSHMAGTFWYHPHHHGSSAIQAGGGACGLLIVEDAVDEVPPVIASMDEKLLMITHVNLNQLLVMESRLNTEFINPDTGSDEEVMLVNGLTNPIMNINANQQYRFRIAFSSVNSYYAFSFNHPSCTLQLIAKDGVYLTIAPRVVSELPLLPGARADVVVQCDGSASQVLMTAFPNNGANLIQDNFWEGTVLTLNVQSSNINSDPLPTFTVNPPCYLADTTSVPSQDIDHFTSVALGQGGGQLLNGVPFQGQGAYLDTIPVGSLVESSVTGIRGHPFHIHVNHFQITGITNPSEYFQLGDWHDTFFFYDLNPNPTITVRYFTDSFTGSQVIHCHFFDHEDLGMMGEFEIVGAEGTVYTNAEALSPSCYRGAGGRGYSCSPDCGSGGTPQTTNTPTRAPTHSPTASLPITNTPTQSNPPPQTNSPTISPPQQTNSPTISPPQQTNTPTISSPPNSPTTNGNENPIVSSLSCDELGWTNAEQFGSSLVCGASDYGAGCSGLISWDEAVAFCTSVGARMCTLAELEADETRQTGCGLDRQMIWSSTACDVDAFALTLGRNGASISPGCEGVSTSQYARCCADVPSRRRLRRGGSMGA